MKLTTNLLLLLLSFTLTGLQAQPIFPEVCLTNHPGNDRYATYSPDGKKILFESDRNGSWDIFIMDLASRQLTPVADGPKDERRPSWHPSGNAVLFESIDEEQTELHLFDITNGQTKVILEKNALSGNYNFARFSPDGQQIAFTLMKNEQEFQLYTYLLSDKKLTRLSNNNLRNAYPFWSPNGKELLCFSRKDTNNEDDEIYRIQLKNNKWTRLTNWPKHNFCPSWSNDGKQIALVISMEEIRPEIYIMNKKGKKLRRITHNEDGDTLPFWSSDDDKLLITAFRNGNFEICEILLTNK